MKNILIILSLIILSGCSLSLEDVRFRETACKNEGGVVTRLYVQSNSKRVSSIYCEVDGINYTVTSGGKLI